MSEGMNAGNAAPSSAGNSDVSAELEKLRSENAELNKAVKGIKADLLSEREKRQQLEQASKNPPAPVGQPGVDPVDQLFQQKTLPLVQQAIEMEKAKAFVAAKVGVDPDEVMETDMWKQLVSKSQTMGIMGSPSRVAKATWQLLEAEKKAEAEAKAKAEAERQRNIQGNASVPSGTPSVPSGQQTVYTSKQIEQMTLAQYKEIREKMAKGEVVVRG